MITTSDTATISGAATQGIALKPAQPLWRFAMVGLGPLGGMLIFALILEFAKRVS